MNATYTCRLNEQSAHLEDTAASVKNTIARRDFDRLLSRRQLQKISSATRIAQGMFQYFNINQKLREMGCDPTNSPMVICNRFANWDYVAEAMSPCINSTMDGVNSYVATAWFPATIQGHLTIENGNVGEAITISTKDPELIRATIGALMASNPQGNGAVILGTFECVPRKIAGQALAGTYPGFFGALSLIASISSAETITHTINAHQELYSHVPE